MTDPAPDDALKCGRCGSPVAPTWTHCRDCSAPLEGFSGKTFKEPEPNPDEPEPEEVVARPDPDEVPRRLWILDLALAVTVLVVAVVAHFTIRVDRDRLIEGWIGACDAALARGQGGSWKSLERRAWPPAEPVGVCLVARDDLLERHESLARRRFGVKVRERLDFRMNELDYAQGAFGKLLRSYPGESWLLIVLEDDAIQTVLDVQLLEPARGETFHFTGGATALGLYQTNLMILGVAAVAATGTRQVVIRAYRRKRRARYEAYIRKRTQKAFEAKAKLDTARTLAHEGDVAKALVLLKEILRNLPRYGEAIELKRMLLRGADTGPGSLSIPAGSRERNGAADDDAPVLYLRVLGTPYAYRAPRGIDVLALGRQRRKDSDDPNEGNDVVIRVPGSDELSLQISRRHLEIQRIDKEFFVIDRSHGRTKLNGRRLVDDLPRRIQSNDRLHIGGVLAIEVQIQAQMTGTGAAKFLQIPATSARPGGLSFEATLGELGRGASGVVYKAHRAGHPAEVVALKFVDSFGNLDSQLLEPEILSRLDHPNIIKLLDYFLLGGKLVIVMEYVECVALDALLADRGRMTSAEVREFLAQVGGALAYAHSRDVIHRDLKPSNILVVTEPTGPRYILADFGISRTVETIQTSKRVGGSYPYMAPEQLRGRSGKQSDLWALGVVAYYLWTHVLPFKPFDGETLERFSKRVYYRNPRPPGAILGEADAPLETIILHLLEKELIHRTDSAQALLDELKAGAPVRAAARPRAAPPTAPTPSWEVELTDSIHRAWTIFWIALILWQIPSGIVAPGVTLAGAYLFFLGQGDRRRPLIVAAGVALMGFGFLFEIQMELIKRQFLAEFLGLGGAVDSDNFTKGEFVVEMFLIMPFYLMAIYNLTKAKKLERDLFLMRHLRAMRPDAPSRLATLREYVWKNPEDLLVQQKYAELLFTVGRTKDAAIEARLVLGGDPYNFSMSLLLAQAYQDLGLPDECIAVCDGYLAVSPQSFEFAELREQSAKLVRSA
jgi:tetratricopeptide (TPR) repeat protein